ncbi:MAG: cytidylate kinase family protein [Candidatus Nitrosopolaris sp.]
MSGCPAVGKTTVAGELAKEFGLKIFNGGDILKKIASDRGYLIAGRDWWDGEEAKKFMAERLTSTCFDKEVDQKLMEIVESGNAVITSYTLPWLTEHPIKFWLSGSQDNRAKRMANRDNIKFLEAKKIVQLRDDDNKKIYRKLYGINFGDDLTVFDFSINTDLLSLTPLIDISKSMMRHVLNK